MSIVNSIAELLTLEQTSEQDVFRQGSLPNRENRAYGGQLLSQAVVAAQRTVERDRTVHSLHGYFLNASSLNEVLEYRVARLRDGRSFSSRRVDVWQGARHIFTATVSFHVAEAGIAGHQLDLVAGIPAPEEVSDNTTYQLPDGGPLTFETAMQVGYVPAELWPADGAFQNAAWMRIREPLADDPALHQAAVAYLSDAVLTTPALEANDIDWWHADFSVASLDHAIWWHRPCRADEWLLAVQQSPNSRDGRGLALGTIYDREGRIVATNTQETLMRVAK